MRILRLAILATALVAISLGCDRKPSDAFLKEVQASLQPSGAPLFQVVLNAPVDGRPVLSNQNQDLRRVMEILGNQMGFLIEVSELRKGPFVLPRYEIKGFKQPPLAGVAFQQEGPLVKVLPDYRTEVVVESVQPPMEGFKAGYSVKEMTAAQRKVEEATVQAFGVKDAKAAVEAEIAAAKEKVEQKGKTFSENVERYAKDNRFKRAWLVSFRYRRSTTLAKSSPFWGLWEAFKAAPSDIGGCMKVFAPEGPIKDFLDQHGKEDVKKSMEKFYVVAFEGQDGKLAKVEGWKSFFEE